MRLLALCAATAAFAATAVTPAGAYEERPMRLPSTGSGVSAASSEPSTWLVAAGFVCPDGGPGAWRVRGMATDPQHRGQGAGAQILDRLVEHAIQQGATRVWCNARTPALGLYERAGFEPESEEFEIPGIGPHFVMALRV
jgi:ribosomal protein S18 acetylase RimI-like enzyme